MKKALTMMVALAVLALVAMPVAAQTYSNTLYGQESDPAKDGYTPIDASTLGGAGTIAEKSVSNWNDKTGGAFSYSAIYSWDGDAWLVIDGANTDSGIDVEADIELYWSETITDPKIYFHIGNPFTATTAQKTAVVQETYATNHACWVGISFDDAFLNGGKTEANFEGGFANPTGRILGGMVGTIDGSGGNISDKSFDVLFLARANGGAYLPPSHVGDGSHNTQHHVMWWDRDDPNFGLTVGTGTIDWLVRIEPTPGQVDGNYHLDPVVVSAPAL